MKARTKDASKQHQEQADLARIECRTFVLFRYHHLPRLVQKTVWLKTVIINIRQACTGRSKHK